MNINQINTQSFRNLLTHTQPLSQSLDSVEPLRQSTGQIFTMKHRYTGSNFMESGYKSWKQSAKSLTIYNIMHECVHIHEQKSLTDAIEYFEKRITNGKLGPNLLKYITFNYRQPQKWRDRKHHYLSVNIFCEIIKSPIIYKDVNRGDLEAAMKLPKNIWLNPKVKKVLNYIKLYFPSSPLIEYMNSKKSDESSDFDFFPGLTPVKLIVTERSHDTLLNTVKDL